MTLFKVKKKKKKLNLSLISNSTRVTSHRSLWCRGCSVQLSTENIIKIY